MSRRALLRHYTLRADAMTPAADFLRALPISGKSLALLGSLSVHAAVALAVVRGAPHAARDTSAPADSTLELTALELAMAEAPEQPIPMPASASAATPARHHHDYQVPPDHDATSHAPSIRHVAALPKTQNAPAAAPALIDAPVPASPRFVMTVGPATRTLGGIAARSEGAEAARASAESGPAAETAADTPAKLQVGSTPSYTREAAAAGVEADVPLEIEIDSAGTVIGARALVHVGYGLEEAALRSVRGYRFSPALRAGKPLAIRMRWLMRFQLR